MLREINSNTQPFIKMDNFQNWDIVTQSWFPAFPSKDLKKGKIKGLNIGKQYIILFRDETGKVQAMDGFCPHMGTNLVHGKVSGEELKCHFHHWKFSSTGECNHIPCGDKIPNTAKIQTYATQEHFGLIWVFPANKAPYSLDKIDGGELGEYRFLPSFFRSCHFHVNMINGMDPQHIQTIHHLPIHFDIDISVQKEIFKIKMVGTILPKTFLSRILIKIFGETYNYTITYLGASIGLLQATQEVRLFGRGPKLPELNLLFGYRMEKEGKSKVYPMALTKKRKGLWGRFVSFMLLNFSMLGYYRLAHEDAMIYESIRFNPANLVPTDRPIAQFLSYVNQLPKSMWSQLRKNLGQEEKRNHLEPFLEKTHDNSKSIENNQVPPNN